jgi:hypothetical protein
MPEGKNPVASRKVGLGAPKGQNAIFLLQNFLHLV